MKALTFKNNHLSLSDVAKPNTDGEALVRVRLSGICNTDLEIVRGYAGFEGTIGHEFVGIVEESDTGALVGKRVVGEINAGCGRCVLCLAGDPRHCPTRTVLGIKGRDGAHADYLTLPEHNLLVVPDSVPDEQAVFAEPLAAAYGILEQVAVVPETKVGVIGDGKLGLLCAQSMALVSKNVFLIGKHKDKMRIAGNRGVEVVLADDAAKLPRDFDVVVEATGSESGFQTALDLLRPRGKLVLKSTFHGETRWPAWRVVVDEITIVGSRCGKFGPALELLRDKRVDVEGMISEEFGLSDGVHAMECATEKGVVKVLLRP